MPNPIPKPVEPTREELLKALRDIVPYAENELASLHDAARRDDEDMGQMEAGDVIEKAQALIRRQEDLEKWLHVNRSGSLTTETS